MLFTSDLDEALALADRIGVMYRGRLVDVFDRDDAKKVGAIAGMMASG